MIDSIFNNVFVVVLYNKSLFQSQTITSLRNSNFDLSRSKIVIWNNGPEPLTVSSENSGHYGLNDSFVIVDDCSNQYLSIIYNKIIKEYKSIRYVILDDDSNVNIEFLESLEICGDDNVLYPQHINNSGKIINPRFSRDICNRKLYSNYNMSDRVFTISSGLVIGSQVCSRLSDQYGDVFDERFALYGVDTSFSIRIQKSNLSAHIIKIRGFTHSLSNDLVEEDRVKNFRYKDKSCALGLIIRYYFSFRRLLSLIKFILDTITGKTKLPFKTFIKTIATGRHFRR